MEAAERLSSWERWKRETGSVRGGFKTQIAGNEEDFRGRIQRYNLLGVSYSNIETNARALYRGSDAADPDSRYYCLVHQMRGRSIASQGRRFAALDPGDTVLLSPFESSEFANRGMIRHLSFKIGEGILQTVLEREDSVPMITIRGRTSLGALLSGLVTQIHSRSIDLASVNSSRPALGMALASLVMPVVRNEADCDKVGDDCADVFNALSVMRYVDANLRNPNLSPRHIAGALGCSVRHLHRAFDGTGATISSYIKQKRLGASAADLRNPRFTGDTITEIAIRWGFSDISHFSRSFREHFGVAPSDFRAVEHAAKHH